MPSMQEPNQGTVKHSQEGDYEDDKKALVALLDRFGPIKFADTATQALWEEVLKAAKMNPEEIRANEGRAFQRAVQIGERIEKSANAQEIKDIGQRIEAQELRIKRTKECYNDLRELREELTAQLANKLQQLIEGQHHTSRYQESNERIAQLEQRIAGVRKEYYSLTAEADANSAAMQKDIADLEKHVEAGKGNAKESTADSRNID